jgi:hypothetical protein
MKARPAKVTFIIDVDAAIKKEASDLLSVMRQLGNHDLLELKGFGGHS